MTNLELKEKYNLSKDDFWEVRGGKWVMSHSACEKIASIEKITFAAPQVHQTVTSICLIGTASKITSVLDGGDGGEETIWATGEASADNVKMAGKYYWAMAEKRLKDRLTLKLINAFDVYSEEEAEDFKKDN